MKGKKLMPMYRAILLLFAMLLASCGGRTGKEGAELVSDSKLETAYLRIQVLPVEMNEPLADSYPGAGNDCRAGVVTWLKMSKRFQVTLVDEVPTRTERDTLIVKLHIKDMRIASKAARVVTRMMFVRAIAAGSHVDLKMTLIDGHTGQIVREKEFSTQRSRGDYDDSITKDMGKIIGDYITAIVP